MGLRRGSFETRIETTDCISSRRAGVDRTPVHEVPQVARRHLAAWDEEVGDLVTRHGALVEAQVDEALMRSPACARSRAQEADVGDPGAPYRCGRPAANGTNVSRAAAWSATLNQTAAVMYWP